MLVGGTLGLGIAGSLIATQPSDGKGWLLAGGSAALVIGADIAREAENVVLTLSADSGIDRATTRIDVMGGRRPERYLGLLLASCALLIGFISVASRGDVAKGRGTTTPSGAHVTTTTRPAN